MKIAPFALASMVLLLPARWVSDKYDRADAKLAAFYADMHRNDLSAATKDVEDAIHLWDWNGRYYAFLGYSRAQTLPVRSSHNGPDRQALTAEEKSVAQGAI